MKKTLLGLLLMIAIMSLMFFMNGVQSIYSVEKEKAAGKKIQEKLVIAHTEIFGKLERPQVVFDHGRHADAFKREGCDTCHPLAPDGNYIFDFPFKAANKTAKEIEDLYHEKCISCHKKVIKEKKKSLPIRCGDCHVKRLASLRIPYPVCEFDFAYHDNHVKKLQNKCILCHHIYNEELVYEEGAEQSCYYCHDEKKKRGPTLAVETNITLKKGLSIRKVSHSRCVNCHLDNLKTANKSGPVECIKCHTGKYRTIAELMDVPRPERDQPKRPFITDFHTEKGTLIFHEVAHNLKTSFRLFNHGIVVS